MIDRKNLFVLLAAGIVYFMSVAPLCAVIYPLEIFTDNGLYNDDLGINLYVDVFNGDGVAKFQFFNDSTVDCSITSVYFDDGTLLGISDITNGPGTYFTQPASPNDLPGGNELIPPFETTGNFSVEGDPPPAHNGINNDAGEWVIVTFDLIGDGKLEDVLGELDNETLRIGVHVSSFEDGSSESAVNGVPEPATICLLGLGAAILRRKRRG